jgi:hypothetical protein
MVECSQVGIKCNSLLSVAIDDRYKYVVVRRGICDERYSVELR